MLVINSVDATQVVRRELLLHPVALHAVRFASAARSDEGTATWSVAGTALAWEGGWPRRLRFCYLVDMEGRVFGSVH